VFRERNFHAANDIDVFRLKTDLADSSRRFQVKIEAIGEDSATFVL